MDSRGSGVWTLIVLAVGLIGCDDEGPAASVPLDRALGELRRAYCERMLSCACDGNTYFSDAPACEQHLDARLDAMGAAATELGLAYDGRCVGEAVSHFDDLGCDRAEAETGANSCTAPCKSFVGDRLVGEECRVSQLDYSTDDCAAGLRCIRTCDDSGVCRDVCLEYCARGEGNCFDTGCPSGEFCNFETSRCDALPTAGEACSQGCAEGLFCDTPDPAMPAERVCAALRANGEACTGHGFCGSGYCPAGRCAPLPELGDSCAGTFTCAPGLSCESTPEGTSTCALAGPAVCTAPPPL